MKFKSDRDSEFFFQHDELSVSWKEHKVKLTRTEFQILRELCATVDHVCTRKELLEKVWGQNVFVESRTIDRHIVQLRRKLRRLGQPQLSVKTVWGIGYRLQTSDSNNR